MFVESMLERIGQGDVTLSPSGDYKFPTFGGNVSELPLVAEFAIRTDNTDQLFAAIAKTTIISKSLVILLTQIEETLALNFNLFSDEELQHIPIYLTGLSQRADQMSYGSLESAQNSMVVLGCIGGIKAECEQARYFYLTGALRQLPNLEIESDRAKIEGFLGTLGFSEEMIGSLNEAEKYYRDTSTEFELKNCLGQIRTFYEHIHLKAAASLARSLNTTVVAEWNPVMTFFENKGFLTPQQAKFARGLFTLLSDEGVHALIAEREFARLLRNMVIEYGLMFLTMMDKKGIKITS